MRKILNFETGLIQASFTKNELSHVVNCSKKPFFTINHNENENKIAGKQLSMNFVESGIGKTEPEEKRSDHFWLCAC